jgi:hypothetical protein
VTSAGRDGRFGARVAAAALLPPLAAGCIAERDRLDVPLVTLVLADSVVAAGDSVRGVVSARDASGVIYLAVSARTADSVSRFGPINLAPTDSIQRAFRLRVPASAAAGALVVVTATAIDEQDFTVEARDTAVVRRPGSAAR